jgi:hypothetical protein
MIGTRVGRGALLLACALLLIAAIGALPARASRALITEEAVELVVDPKHPIPPPEGEIEDACGVAVTLGGDLYVSDHYNQAVDLFAEPFQQIFVGTPPEGPCQLAFNYANEALYANIWHQSVVRLRPTTQVFDQGNSTGVALDEAGNVYANDRTHIAVYSPAGSLLEEIGAGNLIDAYGLAVFGGRVYVPDAATDTVKVFEPATDLLEPVEEIAPPSGFNSLTDGEVTVDPTNGHVLVLDNLQPGYEHPKGAIDEFAEDGEFLGQLPNTVIDAGPSGLVVNPVTGQLYATSGNSEEANVFRFGAYVEGEPEAAEVPGGSPEQASGAALGEEAVAQAIALGATSAAPGPAPSPVTGARAKQRRAHRRARKRRAHRRAASQRSWPQR